MYIGAVGAGRALPWIYRAGERPLPVAKDRNMGKDIDLMMGPNRTADKRQRPGIDTHPWVLGTRTTSASGPSIYANEDILAKWPKGGPQ